MSRTVHETTEVADEDLIRSSRDGDRTALEILYNRHHDAGLRFARRLMGNKADAEDVTQEAFLKVVSAMERGNGPETAFRPYFLRAVRTAAADHWEDQAKETPTDNAGDTPVEDASLASLLHRDDPELVMKAFQSLPLRWMTVLWHAEVEREPPRKIAPVLGMEPGAVSALLMRARKGLREAYLSAYVEAPLRSDCEPTFPYLAATVLGTSSSRDRRKVNDHARECEDCTKVIAQLSDVGATMRAIVAPLILLVPGAALGSTRFPLQDHHLPRRWTGTAVAASVVTLAAGAVTVVAVAGGLVLGSGPSAAPSPSGPAMSRAIPVSPVPSQSPTAATTAPPTPELLPVEDLGAPGADYQAEPLIAGPVAAGALPGTAPAAPRRPATAAGPRAAVRPTPTPTKTTTPTPTPTPTTTPTSTPTPTTTPTSTPTPTTTSTPTPTTTSTPTPTPTEPPTEPNCVIIFDLCFVV